MSITNLDTLLEDVVRVFVEKSKYGVCLVASALLRHHVNRAGMIIEGYLIFDQMKCYVRHYWFRINGKDYDVGSIINTSLNIYVPSSRLSEVPPSNYTYASMLDENELMELEKGYMLYLTNPKRFWKSSPMNWLKRLVRDQIR